MDFYQAFLLSVVEGLTEFIPISSTGHLILATKVLNIEQTSFVKTFEIAIQSGAIASVVFLYWRKLLDSIDLLKKVLVAFIPTGVIGFTVYRVVKDVLIGNLYVTLGALFLGGIAIIAIERYFKKHNEKLESKDLTYKRALLIGIFQSVSMIPGVSRSAATILGGIFLGLSRQAAVELSFLLAIPTMFAATAYDLYKNAHAFEIGQLQILIFGFIVSFVVALASVKWFLSFIRTNTLTPFGFYRIALSIVFFQLFLSF